MNIDGTGVTQLTTDPAIDLQPAWSPDGTKIAYTSSTGTRHLRHEADGTEPGNVTNSSAIESGVTWSPDGTQIAYHLGRRRRQPGHLPAERGRLRARRRNLTNDQTPDHDPDWSPDGDEDRVLQRPQPPSVFRVGLDDRRGRRREHGEPHGRHDLRRRPGLVAGRDADRVRPRRRRTELQRLDGSRRRDGAGQPDAHRRAELLPRLGADPDGTDVRRDLDRGAAELGPGRRLGGDRGHLARRDPRRDGNDGRRSARRHPAWRHPARRHPARAASRSAASRSAASASRRRT